MDLTIASILLLDGLTNGAIYALMALAIVLLFAVTRVIYIPQGEYVAFAALVAMILTFEKSREWLLRAILPLGLLVRAILTA